MKERLNRIMGHIEVTPEMRQRILANIQSMDLTPATRGNAIYLPWLKRYFAVAACLAVMLAGGVLLSQRFWSDPMEPPPHGATEPDGHYIPAESAEDLSRIALFSIEDLQDLPFEPDKTIYSFHSGIAQIWYQGESQEIIYRKGFGKSDVSGINEDFAQTEVVEAGRQEITLKGDGDIFTLAIWHDEQFSYSILLLKGTTEAEWQKILP